MDDAIGLVIVVLMSLYIGYSMFCGAWLLRRYRERQMDSIVWEVFTKMMRRVFQAGLIVFGLVIYGFAIYLFQIPMLPRPAGTVILSVALVLLFSVSISGKRMVERIERGEHE